MTFRAFAFAAILLAAVNLIFSGLALVFPVMIWAALALLSFLLFCALMIFGAPSAFVLMSPLLFLRATEMLSGAAIEAGSYITELIRYGEATGAFNRLFAFYAFLFTSSALVIERAARRHRDAFLTLQDRLDDLWLAPFILFGVYMLHGLVLLVGVRHGFPFLEGIDRFDYRLSVDSRLLTSYLGNRFILILVLALLALSRRWRIWALFGIFSVFATSILFAEKFTALSQMIIMSFIPLGLVTVARDSNLPASVMIKFPLAIITFTLPIVLFVYGDGQVTTESFRKLGERIALQGELWWIADRNHMEFFHFEPQALAADVGTWLVTSAQNPDHAGQRFGLYYVMAHYAPSEIAFSAASKGIGYIFSLFPYLLMTTGVLGLLVFGAVIHLLYALVLCWIMEALARADLILLTIASKIYIFFVSSGFIVGYLWFFFGIKTWILLAAYLVYRYLSRFRISALEPIPDYLRADRP